MKSGRIGQCLIRSQASLCEYKSKAFISGPVEVYNWIGSGFSLNNGEITDTTWLGTLRKDQKTLSWRMGSIDTPQPISYSLPIVWLMGLIYELFATPYKHPHILVLGWEWCILKNINHELYSEPTATSVKTYLKNGDVWTPLQFWVVLDGYLVVIVQTTKIWDNYV